MALQPIWLTPDMPPEAFPDVDTALIEPNGLLAIGGDLEPERLLRAYRRGIFPWFSEGQPILWWSPDPRAVLRPSDLHISRSFRKTLKKAPYKVTVDRDFLGVVKGCALPRAHQDGTWITSAMTEAYAYLHHMGWAHSVECWADTDLVGGLYGVAIGRVFFGESMFSSGRDASKLALAHLCQMDYALIDCQLPSPHLARLGARNIPRRDFCQLLDQLCDGKPLRRDAGASS